MTEKQYQRYIKENNKTELHRKRIFVSNPTAATNKLNHLLKNKWTWGIIPNNCLNFVEEVVQAGRSNFRMLTNCPTLIIDD